MQPKVSDQQALEKLGLQNWLDVTIDQLPAFFSMLPDMDPEEAAKALNLILSVPYLANEIAKRFQDVANNSIASNTTITEKNLDNKRAIIDALADNLHQEGVSEQERTAIRKDLLEIDARQDKLDAQNKSFLEKVIDVSKKHGTEILVGTACFIGGIVFNKTFNTQKK